MKHLRAPFGWRKLLLRVVLPAAIVTGVWAFTWDSGYCSIRDHFLPRRFVEVVPGRLFRSGWIDPSLIHDVLLDHRIGLVVNLTDEQCDSPERDAERRAVRELGIDYRCCPLKGDGTGEVQEYAHAVEAIARAQAQERPVLVHCAAGDKRSGGVIAAYLLLVRGASVAAAKEEIGRFTKHGVPSETVIQYLDDHLAEIGELLRRDGVALAPRESSVVLAGG